jgi:copper chaperone CopZ
MTFSRRSWFSFSAVAGLLLAVQPVHAEYLHIQLRVYGLDCELCARGVSASIHRLPGVKAVSVSLKTGLLEIELVPGNTFRVSDLRKRITENGFRAMDATVTAVGQFHGPEFEVLGSGESWKVSNPESKSAAPAVLTFQIPRAK